MAWNVNLSNQKFPVQPQMIYSYLISTTISVETDAPPKTPATPDSPPDDLERQTLDSLEGLTSVVSFIFSEHFLDKLTACDSV